MNPFLKSLDTQSLGTADRWRHAGLISEDDFAGYLHKWQTGAPRFGKRQCQCDSCKIAYPSPEYDR